MSSPTDLPDGAEGLASALLDSREGGWRDLLPVAERMGYQVPDAAGILPNMTQRLVGTANPSISFTLDGSGEQVTEALILP
jgi:hypothetical protein